MSIFNIISTHKINYCKQTKPSGIPIDDGRLDFINNKFFKLGCIVDKCKDNLTYECLKKED